MDSNTVIKGNRASYAIDSSKPFAYGRISVFFKGTNQKGEAVCIKVFHLSKNEIADKSLLKEFLREVATQMTLKHPNILPIIDFGVGTTENPAPFWDVPFLVLPLCEEGDLRTLMKARSFIPFNSALPILNQIAQAIDYAHACGFIHGDIKPENILITDQGAHCYLSDFGMSKHFAIVERFVSNERAEEGGGGGGATYYLSPEQLHEGRQSPRSDIYSFAILAYEILTGRLPFDSSVPPFQQMNAKICGTLIDPFHVNPTLSQAARDALLLGLRVDSNKRPASAIEFFQNLTRGVPKNQQPVEADETKDRKRRSRQTGFWTSLSPATKVALITALIAAIAGIITALIAIIPELRK